MKLPTYLWRLGEEGGAEAATETAAEPAATTVKDAFTIDWPAVGQNLLDFAMTAVGKILFALVVFFVGKLIIRLILRLMRRSRAMKKADLAVSRFVTSFVRVALNVILIVIIIGVLGVPMSSMVAVIASAAAAIGLALQGALSNFAGGIMILIFHPFHLDDFIDAGGFSGTVTDIGLFYTVLKTPDNKEVTIPNGTVMAQPVTNFSAFDTRRLDLNFTVAYGTDIALVQKALLETAQAHELVLSDPAPFARLTAHEESALKFTMRVWVKSADYWTVNFDLMEQVNRRFVADGIQIPFNQLDVHVVSDRKEEKKDAD